MGRLLPGEELRAVGVVDGHGATVTLGQREDPGKRLVRAKANGGRMRRTPVGIGVIVLLGGSLALLAASDAVNAASVASPTDASASAPPAAGPVQHQNNVIDLWAAGKTTFGVFVPDERPRWRCRS